LKLIENRLSDSVTFLKGINELLPGLTSVMFDTDVHLMPLNS